MKTFLLLVSLAAVSPLWAASTETWGNKPWPKIVDVVLAASVTLRENGDVDYAYTLYNSTSNTLPLYNLSVDTRMDPSQHPLSRRDVTVTHGAGEHFDIIDAAKLVDVIQVAAPPGWTIRSRFPGFWGITNLDIFQMLKPGHSASGFWIETEQPAGIRDFVAEAYSWDFVENREGYQFRGSLEELLAAANRGIEYVGKTVAPVTAPSPFTASTWAWHMQGLAREARGLGWVKTDEQLSRLETLVGRLDVRGLDELAAAVDALGRYVLAEVAAGRMTPEADVLLRVNAEYLLQRARKDPKALEGRPK